MTQKKFNILLLGETQSGKSTLMEALRLYANPKYKIDSSRIGSGNVSLTTEVRKESIFTRLPEYQVFRKGDRSLRSDVQPTVERPVAYDAFIKLDKEAYEDELSTIHGYRAPVQANPWSSDKLEFNIIDTPGLNDTKDQDEDHVVKIISALDGTSLDLVLVTVSRGPFTQGLQQALRSYMDLFPQLRDIVAFVHTRIDYLELHPDMTDFHSYMRENMVMLSALMGRWSFPHFWIDCDFESTKPIHKCITNNTLRRVLRLAVENKPVVMLHSQTLNKTPKMKDIDRIIKDHAQAVIQAIESTLDFKDKDEAALLKGVYVHATEINELRAKINISQGLQKSYQTDELGLLFEERLDVIQRLGAKDEFHIVHYAGKHKVDEEVVWCENMEFYGSRAQQPPENWTGKNDVVHVSYESCINEHLVLTENWYGTFKKEKQDYNGYSHVKLYAKKCNRFKPEIEDLTSEIDDLEKQLLHKINESSLQSKDALSQIQSLVDVHHRHMEVIRLASARTLHRDLFVELVKARAFAGPINESSQKVAASYRLFADKVSKLQ